MNKSELDKIIEILESISVSLSFIGGAILGLGILIAIFN